MDIRRLKYFIVVAEEGSISKAANRLHITQPPLTRHMRLLEEDFGIPLFKRSTMGIELTSAGKVLLDHARKIKSYVEFATDQIRKVSSGNAGQIDIGVFGSSMLDAIPSLMESFTSTHRDVKIVLHVVPRDQQIVALQQGRILIGFDRYFPEVPELQSEFVLNEALWVALRDGHKLSDQEFIRLDDLRGEPLIGEQNLALYLAGKYLFAHDRFDPLVVQKAPDMISAVVMVSGGFGSALVPQSALNLRLPRVVFRPLITDFECRVDLHCLYRKDEQSPLLHALLRCIRSFQQAT